jgi:hypothetical protein
LKSTRSEANSHENDVVLNTERGKSGSRLKVRSDHKDFASATYIKAISSSTSASLLTKANSIRGSTLRRQVAKTYSSQVSKFFSPQQYNGSTSQRDSNRKSILNLRTLMFVNTETDDRKLRYQIGNRLMVEGNLQSSRVSKIEAAAIQEPSLNQKESERSEALKLIKLKKQAHDYLRTVKWRKKTEKVALGNNKDSLISKSRAIDLKIKEIERHTRPGQTLVPNGSTLKSRRPTAGCFGILLQNHQGKISVFALLQLMTLIKFERGKKVQDQD